jgi:antitoxin VapB
MLARAFDGRIMRLNIKNPETDRLARLLAKETGETITAVVTQALRDRLESVRRERASGMPNLETRKKRASLHKGLIDRGHED